MTTTTQASRTRTWEGLILETRYEFGSAARMNRARYTGSKVHELVCEYVIGLEEGAEVRPGSFAAKFQREGKPVLFSCRPLCGCTVGQFAGRPYGNLTGRDVTCSKCR